MSFSTVKDYILFDGPVLWFSIYQLFPDGPSDIDVLKYPLLDSFLRIIKKCEKGVDNKIRQSNIKLAIINRKISSKAVSIVVDIERLYNFVKLFLESQFINKVLI